MIHTALIQTRRSKNTEFLCASVGKLKTAIGVTTCTEETVTNPDTNLPENIVVCSTENVVKVRMTGKDRQQFDDVSKELLTICLDN